MTFSDIQKYEAPTVLTIAGFDPSGGAGIQGDTKTITSLGVYATNVLTSLPIQNTYGVKEVFEIPPKVIEKQLQIVFEDMIPTVIKIGMLHSVEIVEVVVNFLKNYNIPIVFDPVMIATSGDSLVKSDTVEAFTELLFPISTLITPNLDEASILVREKVDTVEKMEMAGEKICNMNINAVLIKGGHLDTEYQTSFLWFKYDGQLGSRIRKESFTSKRLDIKYSHGAGCTLSSAIASYLARGYLLNYSVKKSFDYMRQAIFFGRNIQVGEQEKHELIVHTHGQRHYLYKKEIANEENK